jgi:hypothetical protein
MVREKHSKKVPISPSEHEFSGIVTTPLFATGSQGMSAWLEVIAVIKKE